MAWKEPQERFRERYPWFHIALGLLMLGHIVFQIATGEASVGQIGGPITFQQTPVVFGVVLAVEAVLGGGLVADGGIILLRKQNRSKQ
ncbi:MAG: hypothetical protein ACLFRL_07630 [Desulfohalobiaceae bacterium]